MRTLLALLVGMGFNPKKFWQNRKGIIPFFRDWKIIRRQLQSSTDFSITRVYPILSDRFGSSAYLKGHYFLQDLYVAGRVLEHNPARHVDIGSRIDGFVAHLACVREVEVFDIRPQESQVKNIRFLQADFMNVPEQFHQYTASLSSLNVLEHFGLGRYNDPIDINGHLKGLESMYKTLQPGGKFYFSTPIGPQRIEFNAHRVFSLAYLIELFNGKYTIDRFSFIDDQSRIHVDVILDEATIRANAGCVFGCGIFEMTKK